MYSIFLLFEAMYSLLLFLCAVMLSGLVPEETSKFSLEKYDGGKQTILFTKEGK